MPPVVKKPPESPPKRPQERGEPVVQRTLTAVLGELGRVGYASLRVEEVAERAGVNKTTVYRRWPTKEALVYDALASIVDDDGGPLPDTGSLREDLLTVGRRFIARTASPAGQSVVRMLAAERPDSELSAIARAIQVGHEAVPRAILARACERGELRAGVDPEFMFDVMRGACDRVLLRGERLSLEFITRLVDLLLAGAEADPPAGAE